MKRFLKLGATAYGGPAMIGQIKETVAKKYGWVKEEEFLRGMALCQLIPGATMVQMVTFIGEDPPRGLNSRKRSAGNSTHTRSRNRMCE